MKSKSVAITGCICICIYFLSQQAVLDFQADFIMLLLFQGTSLMDSQASFFCFCFRLFHIWQRGPEERRKVSLYFLQSKYADQFPNSALRTLYNRNASASNSMLLYVMLSLLEGKVIYAHVHGVPDTLYTYAFAYHTLEGYQSLLHTFYTFVESDPVPLALPSPGIDSSWGKCGLGRTGDIRNS